jgi:hypothetical protein
MSNERWWDDTYRGKPTYSEKNLSQYHFVHHKSHTIFLWRLNTIHGHGLPFRGFAITLIGHTTLCTTPLDERSARCRDVCLTHNIHKRQTFVPPVGFETTIPANKRPQTDALGRAVKGIASITIGLELNSDLQCEKRATNRLSSSTAYETYGSVL